MLLDHSPLVLIILTTASTIFDITRSEPDGLMDFMKKDKKIEREEPKGLESLRVISDKNRNKASSRKFPQFKNGPPKSNIETGESNGLMNFVKKRKKSETNGRPKNLNSLRVLSNAAQNENTLKIPKLSKVHHRKNMRKQKKSFDLFNKLDQSFSLNELDGLQGLRVVADSKKNKNNQRNQKSTSTESNTKKHTSEKVDDNIDEITEIIPTEDNKVIENSKHKNNEKSKKDASKESNTEKNNLENNAEDHRLHLWEDKTDDITTQMITNTEDTKSPQDSDVTDLISPGPEEKDKIVNEIIEEVSDENENESSKVSPENLLDDKIEENSEKIVTEIIPNQVDQVIASSSNENRHNAKNAKITVNVNGRPQHESLVVRDDLDPSDNMKPFERAKDEVNSKKLDCIPCSAKHIRCNGINENNANNAKITVMKNGHPEHASLVVLEQKQELENHDWDLPQTIKPFERANDQAISQEAKKSSDSKNMLDEHYQNQAKNDEKSKS